MLTKYSGMTPRDVRVPGTAGLGTVLCLFIIPMYNLYCVSSRYLFFLRCCTKSVTDWPGNKNEARPDPDCNTRQEVAHRWDDPGRVVRQMLQL